MVLESVHDMDVALYMPIWHDIVCHELLQLAVSSHMAQQAITHPYLIFVGACSWHF